MRLVLVCMSLLWAFAPGAHADDGGKADPHARVGTSARAHAQAATLRKAEQLLARGKRERALRELARALSGAPTDALLSRYAELLLPFVPPQNEAEAKALRDAAEPFAIALEKRGQEQDTLPPALALPAAWALFLRGDSQASEALIARYARADDPHTLPCLRAMAALSLRAGQPAVARSLLNLARGFAPSDPDLAGEIGLVALAEGDTQAALSALAERFASDPSSLLARRDFAYALSSAGRPAEGFALLGVVASACGAEPSCLLERARWAFEAGLIGEALAGARLLLQREPEHLDGLFLAADALLAQGELGQAQLMYQTILRIAPGDLRAKNALLGLEGSVPGAP